MIILNNIFECSGCHMRIIDEERNIHKCRRPKGFHIKYDILWLSDGITEYPLKLSKIKKNIKDGKIDQPQGNRENNYRRGNSTS